MALEVLAFGSETFEIPNYQTARRVGKKQEYYPFERFTVGGYDWEIQYYPRGDDKKTSDYVSVYVRVLNATNEVQAICSIRLWDWGNTKWSTKSETPANSNLQTFGPPDYRWGFNTYIKWSSLGKYLDKDRLKIKVTLKIKRTLFVKMPRNSEISFGHGLHTVSYAPVSDPALRIYCKAIKDFSLTVRNGTVVLAPADASDPYQHWVKKMSRDEDGKEVTDSFGRRAAFALLNRVTGDALKTPARENEPVSLVRYNPNDNSMRWSTNFIAIRIADNPLLNMTAIPSSKDKFNDGDKIFVKKSENTQVQHWKIVDYNFNVPY